MKSLKYTVLATAIVASLFSLNASANGNARANGGEAVSTLASVGYRPIAQAVGGKYMDVSGKLMTGETLTINKFFITDIDGDAEGAGKNEANRAKTLATVTWTVVDKDGNETNVAASAGKPTMTIPGEAAGGTIKVTYTVKTKDGTNPDTANEATVITLTPSNSGVSGDTNGVVAGKLSAVTITVDKTPTLDLNGTTAAGTPIVGAKLTAALTCTVESDCTNPETKYNFTWYIDNAQNGSFATEIGQGQTYTVKGTEQNKFFKVVVTPKTTKAEAPASSAKRR